MNEQLHIGFVGASGLMGHGMAKNLVTKGFRLSYTVHRRDVEDLRDAGATRADDHAALGRDCDVVFICVTSADDVTDVVTGPHGLLTDPREDLVIVDCSTSEPTVTLRLAEAAQGRGVRFVDAPLTRTPKDAEAGTLNVLVGGDADTLARIRPALDAFAENIIPIGAVGSAHTIKLLNNFVFQAITTSLAEAFAVAARAGVDPQKLLDVMLKGGAASPVMAQMAGTLRGNYDGLAFELDNARKDVRYYGRLAGEQGHPTPIGDGVHETLALASALGFGDAYVLSVVAAHEKLAGTPIRTGEASNRIGRQDDGMPRYDLNINTVGELLADPDVVALVERHRPGLAASDDLRSVAHLTVNQALGEALRYASPDEVQRARAELERL